MFLFMFSSPGAADIGWDGSHLVSEGAFLELFVPVAPEEPPG